MTDARDWQPPTHAEVRAVLPKTQAERNDLAARIGVGARLMRYWWVGAKVPGYAHWRLLVEDGTMTDLQRELDRLAEEGDHAALVVKTGGGLALPRNILPRASVGEREVFKIGEPPTPAEFECIKVTETATFWRVIRDHPGFERKRERDDERRVPRYP